MNRPARRTYLWICCLSLLIMASSSSAATPISLNNIRILVEESEGFEPHSWAPGNQSIALLSDKGDIHLADVKTGMVWHVYGGGPADMRLAWVENGRSLRYYVPAADGASIRTFDIDTGEFASFIIRDEWLGFETWRGIEAPEHRILVTMSVEDDGAMTYYGNNGSRPLLDWDAAFSRPALSPDGTQLAFQFTNNGSEESGAPAPRGLCVLATKSSDARLIDPDGEAPAWLPTSDWLIFSHVTREGEDVVAADLRVWSVESGEIRVLTASPSIAESISSISEDGKSIAFASHDGKIYTADIVYE